MLQQFRRRVGIQVVEHRLDRLHRRVEVGVDLLVHARAAFLFPRGFVGEQPYWTIIGIDGGKEQGLIGEEGAVELGKGAPSIQPFVHVDGKLVSWADVELSQSLQDGYLPIPSVQWKHPDFGLRVTTFMRGDDNQSQMLVRYQLQNTSATEQDFTLALAAQPL